MSRSALLNVMVQVTTKAGRTLGRKFVEIENLQSARDDAREIADDAQKEAAKTIRLGLDKVRENVTFLTPDDTEPRPADNKWIISPLDGYNNFLHSIPLFSVGLALEYNGELMAGVIYNPLSEELFTAEKGKGAFCNDKRMRIVKRDGLKGATIAGEPINAKDIEYRIIGCTALNLAWTAMGRFDGFNDSKRTVYEVAAGMLMIREAGGFVSAGNPDDSIFQSGNIIAGPENIHNALVDLQKISGKDTALKQASSQELEDKLLTLTATLAQTESEKSQLQTLLDQQVSALRTQIASLAEALEASEAQNKESSTKIADLERRPLLLTLYKSLTLTLYKYYRIISEKYRG